MGRREGDLGEISSLVGVWIFSGTTQSCLKVGGGANPQVWLILESLRYYCERS